MVTEIKRSRIIINKLELNEDRKQQKRLRSRIIINKLQINEDKKQQRRLRRIIIIKKLEITGQKKKAITLRGKKFLHVEVKKYEAFPPTLHRSKHARKDNKELLTTKKQQQRLSMTGNGSNESEADQMLMVTEKVIFLLYNRNVWTLANR